MRKHKTLLNGVIIITMLCIIILSPDNRKDVCSAEVVNEYDAINGLYITLDDETANSLRNKYFEGYITFEYLDEGTDNFIITSDTERPATQGSDYSVVASINKGNTGNWVKAKVRVFPENTAFIHGAKNDSDFIFKGDVRLKNISFNFDILTLNP